MIMNKQEKISQDILSVVEKSNLRSISTKQTYFDMHAIPESVSPQNTQLKIDYSFHHQLFKEEPFELVCFIKINILGTAKKGTSLYKVLENQKVFEFQCTFAANYRLKDINISKEACEAFTRYNGLFNTYPFIREHTHSSFSKMGLVGFLLPLLKPPTKPVDSSKQMPTTKK